MKIGIIGGGQLGMMMAEVAVKDGHQIISLDPNNKCSITRYSTEHIAKDYNDYDALKYMNDTCDVLTYEFENVDLDILKKFITKLPQKTEALRISRNRITEKKYAQSLGIQTPKFVLVQQESDIFYPSIVKTTTGGYDGKGQFKIIDNNDIDQLPNINEVELVCEELIHFDYEISVVATRDIYGSIVVYPIPVNSHKNGILHTSLVRNNLPVEITEKAIHYTTKILEDLDYVGTLAVEYFVVKHEVLFNEFAPRPHNSGHYTQDGCNVSQFENHIRAITNQKTIRPTLKKDTIMLNVLGQNKTFYNLFKDLDNCYIHDYFKHSDKKNRKIGHINYLFENEEQLTNFIQKFTKEI